MNETKACEGLPRELSCVDGRANEASGTRLGRPPSANIEKRSIYAALSRDLFHPSSRLARLRDNASVVGMRNCAAKNRAKLSFALASDKRSSALRN